MDMKRYRAERAGWLLAASAPKNIATGEALLENLTPYWQAVAKDYARGCVATYLNEGGEAMVEEYKRHKYAQQEGA